MKVKARKYINLWMPPVSFWSFVQSRPFTIISWADVRQDTLDLLIEPLKGLTRELLHHAKKGGAGNSDLVLFSGSHGTSIPVGEYENIVRIASGFGISAHLSYLK